MNGSHIMIGLIIAFFVVPLVRLIWNLGTKFGKRK